VVASWGDQLVASVELLLELETPAVTLYRTLTVSSSLTLNLDPDAKQLLHSYQLWQFIVNKVVNDKSSDC
jgi:hypothetical protein